MQNVRWWPGLDFYVSFHIPTAAHEHPNSDDLRFLQHWHCDSIALAMAQGGMTHWQAQQNTGGSYPEITWYILEPSFFYRCTKHEHPSLANFKPPRGWPSMCVRRVADGGQDAGRFTHGDWAHTQRPNSGHKLTGQVDSFIDSSLGSQGKSTILALQQAQSQDSRVVSGCL